MLIILCLVGYSLAKIDYLRIIQAASTENLQVLRELRHQIESSLTSLDQELLKAADIEAYQGIEHLLENQKKINLDWNRKYLSDREFLKLGEKMETWPIKLRSMHITKPRFEEVISDFTSKFSCNVQVANEELFDCQITPEQSGLDELRHFQIRVIESKRVFQIERDFADLLQGF